MLARGAIGSEAGWAAVVVGVGSFRDLVAEGLADVERPGVLVLVDVGQLVDHDRQVGTVDRRHVDAVEGRKGPTLVELEDQPEYPALIDPYLVPAKCIGSQHALGGGAFGAGQ